MMFPIVPNFLPSSPLSMELSTRNPQFPANGSLLSSATGGYDGYVAGGLDAEDSGTGVASATGGVTGGRGMSSMTESMGRTMAAVVRASGVAGNRSPAGRRAYPAADPVTAATPLTPPRSSKTARGAVAESGDAPVISGSQPVWAEAFPVTPSKITKETVVVRDVRDVRDVRARHADTAMGGVNEPPRVSSVEHWLEVEGMDRGDLVTSLRHEDTPLAGASSAAARRVDRRRQFEIGGRIEQGPGVVVAAGVAESKKVVSAGVERVDGDDEAAHDMSAIHHHDDSSGPSATVGRAATRMPEVLPMQHSSPWNPSVLAPTVTRGRGIEYGRDEGRPITVGGGDGGGVQDQPIHVAAGHGTPGGLLSPSEAEHAFPAPSCLRPHCTPRPWPVPSYRPSHDW